jgi:carbon starvation protein
VGTTFESAATAVSGLGFQITPEDLAAASAAVSEPTLVSRTGGAPTLAVGISEIFSGVIGGDSLKAFWYHFAIMFEALFILTTVDAGTRVGRFMLQDTLGNVWKPIGRVSWQPGVWGTSAVVVGAWGYFLYTGVSNPLGGINQLFPLFGIANQLLAAVALMVATVILVKSGKAKYAWVTGIPLAWDAAVTLTASWQKVFSDDPRLGFFAQRERYADALDAGRLLAPAKSTDDMEAIIFNSTLDGVLAALFAVLIIIVIADGLRMCVRAVRASDPLPTTEAPFEKSTLVAPDGLIPTAEERELVKSGPSS